MITHAVELRIERPVEDVFAFLTNADNHPKWDTSSLSMTPQRAGPWEAGLVFDEVRKMGARQISFQSKVAALTPNESMEIESLSGAEYHGHWRFSPDGTGTRLTWSCEMKLKGPARLAEKAIAKPFKAGADQNFARLKELLDGGAV